MLFFAEMWERFSITACARCSSLPDQACCSVTAKSTSSTAPTPPCLHPPMLGAILPIAISASARRCCSVLSAILWPLHHGSGRDRGQNDRHHIFCWRFADHRRLGLPKANISVMSASSTKYRSAPRWRYTIFYMVLTWARRSARSRGYLGETLGWAMDSARQAAACSSAWSSSCSARGCSMRGRKADPAADARPSRISALRDWSRRRGRVLVLDPVH